MTARRFTRRSVLEAGLAAGGLMALSGSALAEDTRLRMFWWGSKERAERTDRVNALYQQKNAGTTITGESLGWTDYWPRLATQAAGRNVADLVQMDYRYIFEYARRGALLPLDPFVGKHLTLKDFSPAAVDSGKVDGKIYGVSLGLNSTAMMIDRGMIEQLGLRQPGPAMTWSEMAELATEISTKANRPGYFGINDGGRYEPALEVFLRQRGKGLYADGKLAFDEKDMADWFGFWAELRKRGGCAAPDVAALEKGEIDTSLLTLGKAAMVFAHSNQLVGYQAVSKGKLGLNMYPQGAAGSKPGQYLKPSMLLSISARAKLPEAAVKVLDFYVADVEAGKLLGVERGVPASDVVRRAVVPTLDALGNAMAEYISLVSDKVGPLPPPPPQGAGEVEVLLRRVNEQVGFGRLSPVDGGRQFVKDATAILARG